MNQHSAFLELFRWGFANVPGIILHYSKELDIDIEDIGVITAIFYTFERTKPLFQLGVQVGQVLQVCPALSKNKLSKRLAHLAKLEIIAIEGANGFADRVITLEPLLQKLEHLLLRDHVNLHKQPFAVEAQKDPKERGTLLENYQSKIEQLELQLEVERHRYTQNELMAQSGNGNVKKLGDFIAKKTGNLMSNKMSIEVRKWLEEMNFTPEFLVCMLELCFERNIYSPSEVSRIARDLKEYSISTLDGLESYFSNYVDIERNGAMRQGLFDPDIAIFGNFTGIDMNAEARKKVYYRWRYDWGFSHAMIMKAGELMCQHTRNGGLEYIDSVLHNWLSKEIRQVEQVEKDLREHKAKSKGEKKLTSQTNKDKKQVAPVYETFIPPTEIKSS